MTLFNPLIQPSIVLSGVQKFLLRVVLGWAGKTIMHRERLVEVLETHDALHQLFPLMESDLSESNPRPFWTPRRQSDRKTFNLERRNTSRRHRTIGVDWGDARPFGARRQRLRSRFPSPSYLAYLITELGYDSDAAFAAFGRPLKFLGRPDRRRTAVSNTKGYQRMDYGDNFYAPAAQPVAREQAGDSLKSRLTWGCPRCGQIA